MAESASEVPGGRTISLGHLIALNDEMAALTRAGLPLERGLRDVGRDLSGGLSAAMLRLSARMDQGEGLSEALAADKEGFPPVYRAVVEAGIRAGRLPAALESLAGFVRSYDDARRIDRPGVLVPDDRPGPGVHPLCPDGHPDGAPVLGGVRVAWKSRFRGA